MVPFAGVIASDRMAHAAGEMGERWRKFFLTCGALLKKLLVVPCSPSRAVPVTHSSQFEGAPLEPLGRGLDLSVSEVIPVRNMLSSCPGTETLPPYLH